MRMHIEGEIRRIMRMPLGIPKKAERICRFMNWDKKKLIKTMEEIGTFGGHNRTKIIKVFWPDRK